MTPTASPLPVPVLPPTLPSRPYPAAWSFWPLHLGGWATLGVAMWLGVLPEVDRPALALAHKMIFAALGAALTLALRPMYRALRARRPPVPVLVAACAAASYAVSLVWSGATTAATFALDAVVLGDPFPAPRTWWVTGGALFFSFVVVAWSALYVGLSTDRDARASRERALAAEALAAEARLAALRYQLDPHFLFNTLNALSTLIVAGENGAAERMVARLADFLRLTLARGEVAEVALADEIDFVERYLEVERVRFGDRLRVTVDVETAALSVPVPPLLLQPLVENAVRHGVLPREEGGAVAIEGRRTAGGGLRLRVSDDGPDASAASGVGVGLANVRARLDAAYGGDASFEAGPDAAGGWTAEVTVPHRDGPGRRGET